MHLSDYEKERLLNIQRNKEKLESLGLGSKKNNNKINTEKRKNRTETPPVSPAKKRKVEPKEENIAPKHSVFMKDQISS